MLVGLMEVSGGLSGETFAEKISEKWRNIATGIEGAQSGIKNLEGGNVYGLELG